MPGVTVTLKSLRKKEFDFEPKSLGEHIKRERLKRGLTQKELAKLLGVNPWTELNWETGATKPLMRSIPTIINFLGYDPFSKPMTLPEKRCWERLPAVGWSVKQAARIPGLDYATPTM